VQGGTFKEVFGMKKALMAATTAIIASVVLVFGGIALAETGHQDLVMPMAMLVVAFHAMTI